MARFDPRGNRLVRMFLAGGVNTLFGFTVFSAVLAMGTPRWVALLIGLLCGTVFNFMTTGHYVFRQLVVGKYPRFLACYLLVYLVNLEAIRLLWHATGNDIVSQAVLSLPMAVFSYVLMGRYVFTAHADAQDNPGNPGRGRHA